MATAVSTITGEEVQYLIAKMDRAAPLLPFSNPQDVPLQDRSAQHTSTTQAPPKHIQQVDSITNHLKAANLCQPGTTFCELGCGTAKLSDHVSEAMNGHSSHVLIDRKIFGSTRLRDGAIVGRGKEKSQVRRITMDIGEINNLPSTCDVDSVVAISKHLCGPAADLSIQCCVPTRTPMAVATCCHYLCNWKQFSNTRFFETLGFTERDFQVLAIISQWASMKKASKTKRESNDHSTGWTQLPTLASLPPTIHPEYLIDSKEFETNFPREEKTALGKRCKLFLDTARAYRLQEAGYRVKLVRYTTMSMEDHLIMAVPADATSGVKKQKRES
jgi:tRNA:m4X modification enzyme